MNLHELLQKALLNARAICDQAEKESRDFTAEERNQIEGYLKEANDLKEQIKAAEGDANLRKAVLDFAAAFEAEPGKGSGQPTPAAKRGTIGERFVNAPEWKAWLKSMGGRVPEKGRIAGVPPVEYKDLLGQFMRRKELITGESDTSAGAFVQTDYTGIYEPLGRYDLNVLNLVQRRTTTSDLVHFVRQTTQITQATPVAEANVTEYSGATGEVSGEKPEGTSKWEAVTEPVKTIAVWIPATRRALADVGQLRGLIDQELRSDTYEELEDQILNGDNIGENFHGILNTAGILTQAWNADILTTTRQAITTLLVTGRSRPTAWVFNPLDWEQVELMQDTTGRFYGNGPFSQGPMTLWGVPVAQSQSIDEGTFLLGDWRKAILWDREAATITVSDSHEDFFIRNMVAILCELRAALGVIRPSGFVVIEEGS